MGLKTAVLAVSLAALGHSAPILRLVGSAIGPVPVTPGSSGATQTVEAYNIGDGSLALNASASVSWISASIGGQRRCVTTNNSQQCNTVQIALNTGSLSAGMFTGIVTVEDPNAVDAPQTITVTVRVGGIDVYVAPGTSRDTYISTSSAVTATTSTQQGGSWLTVSLDGTGSFRFTYPHRVRLTADAGLAAGNYSGSVATSGSGTPADNVTVPVTMRVVDQPIVEASPYRVDLRVVEGGGPAAAAVAVANVGTGNLSGLAVSTSGGVWLSATLSSRTVVVTADAKSLAPGTYTGTVAIESNAANRTLTLPVNLEVIPKGPPRIRYQGVVDNGTYIPGDPGTPGGLMVIFGEQLISGAPVAGKAPPLATDLGGATVLVNGRPAPMIYAQDNQINFQLPMETPLGRAVAQVQRDGQSSNLVSVNVVGRAPRLLVIPVNGVSWGAIYNTDYSIPMPEGTIPGVFTRAAKPGDTLSLYAIGLGATSPVAGTGAPAPSSPLAELTTRPTVIFGSGIAGIPVEPLFAGLAPAYAGLYQVNVTIPPDVPKGTIGVNLVFPDSVSNIIQIAVQ